MPFLKYEACSHVSDHIHHDLIIGLLSWSLLSLGSATIVLYINTIVFWRSFWFMSGLWGLIDGAIVWFTLWQGPQSAADLSPILKLNAGLDLAYIATSLFLMTRKTPTLRGFGLAVFSQGLFLLGFDVYFWWRCTQALGPGR